PEFDKLRLGELGFEIVPVPEGVTLSQSILRALDHRKGSIGPLHILHGDTLVGGISLADLDIVSEGVTESYYSWAEYRKKSDGSAHFYDGLPSGGEQRNVLSGYFAFSDGEKYVSVLKNSDGGFIDSLNLYASENPLRIVSGSDWLDFGHMELYHQSVAKMPTQRVFNRIDFTRQTVIKTSNDQTKIDAEAHWFETVPAPLRLFTPNYLGRTIDGGDEGYATEYLYLSTLSDLYVFGRLPLYVWQHVFRSCADFLTAARENSSGPQMSGGNDDFYLSKTTERLNQYSAAQGIDLDQRWISDGEELPSLNAIAKEMAEIVSGAGNRKTQIVHGDFCFSNIFYDFRANRIRVVDPRGHMGGGAPSIFGDVRYDIAKMHHSVIGGYDFIIAGRYKLKASEPYTLSIELADQERTHEAKQAFLDFEFAGYPAKEDAISALSILMFLSMLPLHSDRPDRQQALLANALRLYLGRSQGAAL
ncbi:MAG: hypothetical protein HQ503_02510, partial [Rhodospirillales bacterium]|nr:hypothetical protein [Rhodospirillales bacterium]